MSRNHVGRRLLSSPSCVFGSIAMAFKFLFALRTKRKKTFHLDDLPLFKWDDISAKEVIGQGAFGAVFITHYNVASKPAETFVVKKAAQYHQ